VPANEKILVWSVLGRILALRRNGGNAGVAGRALLGSSIYHVLKQFLFGLLSVREFVIAGSAGLSTGAEQAEHGTPVGHRQ
jgi:hypothetical protein